MAQPTRPSQQTERPPAVGGWRVRGPEGPTHEVIVTTRVTNELQAHFVFISRDGEHALLRSVQCETVGKRTTASITTRQLRLLPFDQARTEAWKRYSRAGKGKLARSAGRPRLHGAPKSSDEYWLKYAVEYVAASDRDPRHVYEQMGQAFSTSTTLGQLQYWVAQCRERRLITPHPRRELTRLARRLLKKHPVIPWEPKKPERT